MILTLFTETRMFYSILNRITVFSIAIRQINAVYLNFFGVVNAKRQFIAVNLQLHGVAHGGELYKRGDRAGYYTHIEKMLP